MKHFLLFLLVVSSLAAIVLRVRYGGGDPYPDLSTPPILDESALEEVLRYPEPIGNVAVSAGGRIFFTVHPESRPRGNKLLEWVDGAAVPYPSGTVQPHLFDTVLGLVVDRQNRLWTIDNGNHGFGDARLLAFDLATGNVVHDFTFRPETAPRGSFLQDLQVSQDGGSVFIADASVWRKRPAIVVYDVQTRSARRVLEAHQSVTAQNILINTPVREMTFLGGLVSLKTGVDGIAIDHANEWLYYGAINNGGLYRARIRDLTNAMLPARQLENEIERFSDKPLSDGLSSDLSNNIYVTDVEHGAIFIVSQDRELKTLIRSPRIRWADALSFGPDGWLYLADSAIPEQVLKSKEYIQAHGPYFVYRFKPGFAGIPGH
ncbi:MAG: L-dopachrome tautomerase-related protein [Proteobacteria bacterium]|nr:L-dopachrome tautomerase-related protein [Pseudomonadota bacterium]MDA0992673.1 L-dopachrome tautomerase-related protein [Pseudomonadota bacterium]